MSLKERFVARPTKCKYIYRTSIKNDQPNQRYLIRALILFSIRFHLGIEHLKLQETYTYELLEYLEALDPGRTWTKDQLLQNLQGVIIKKAHGVSKLIVFRFFCLRASY